MNPKLKYLTKLIFRSFEFLNFSYFDDLNSSFWWFIEMEYLRRQTLGIMVHFADLEKHSRLIGRSPRSRTWNSHFNNCYNWRLSRIDIQGLKAFDVDNDSNIQNISIARLKTNFHAFHCNFGKNSSEYGTKNTMDHARNLIMVFYVPSNGKTLYNAIWNSTAFRKSIRISNTKVYLLRKIALKTYDWLEI